MGGPPPSKFYENPDILGHPHEISNKTVHWDFAYEGDGFLEQPADEYPRINPSRGDDGAALEFVNRLGWT